MLSILEMTGEPNHLSSGLFNFGSIIKQLSYTIIFSYINHLYFLFILNAIIYELYIIAF